jgi:Tol biopolymer transport system component
MIFALAAVGILLAETPEPRRIMFARVNPQPGQLALFVAAADGRGEHPLLDSPGTDYDPVWAPDGRSIVFTSERNGSADLFRVKPDGTELTRLTDDPAYEDQAAFSPDSKQLVFVSTRDGGLPNLWTIEWIAFSSGRGNPLPFAHGRWERLQVADLFIVHPDGSGLRKLTKSGNFCGSPKWTSDSSRLIAYCMPAQATLEARRLSPEAGNDTRLVSIDIATGRSTDVAAGPGVKINPSPLAGNDIGYIMKGTKEEGIYYTSGRRGPRGSIRAASWSPDFSQVVFHRRADMARRIGGTEKTFSRNSRYELSLSGILPAFSPSGREFVTNTPPSGTPQGASLSVTTVDTGQSRVVYQDKTRNVLAGAWSPSGDRIIFGVGGFAAFFGGFHSQFLKSGDRVEGGAMANVSCTERLPRTATDCAS